MPFEALPADPRRARARIWTAVAALVFVLALGASFVGASFVAANDRGVAERAARAKQTAIVAALQRALARDADFIVSVTGQSTVNPNMTTTQLREWIDAVEMDARFPEIAGLALIDFVRPAELPGHIARVLADPPSGTYDPSVGFKVDGSRPYHCLVAASLTEPGAPELPIDFDFCRDDADLMLAPRDTGRATYVAYEFGGKQLLALSTPRFVGGGLPPVAEREAKYRGLIGTSVEPTVILNAALKGQRDVHADLQFDDGTSKATFRAGIAPEDASRSTLAVAEHWRLVVSQPRISISMLTDGKALLVLVAGAAIGVLLSVLIYVLGTGRARALRLVAKTTGELRHQALHDPLTGLANRALLVDRVDQLLARSRRNKTQPAALFLDLDGFKGVNDSRGHDVGDRLLQSVAARLTGAVRGADTIARLGGDEFVVLIDGASIDVGPELVAERLLDVLRQPYEDDEADVPLRISASIGIATGDRATADELLRDADVALYEAKNAGRDRYAQFLPEMETALRHGIELEFDLRGALERDEFQLLYQPIYNLDDLAPIGVEALLRWNHPTLGVVMPDEFIPILERTGSIIPVGGWVLREACEQMAEWHRIGSPLSVSVNVSARQFDSDTIVDHVRDALSCSGLEPTALTIEVTESAVMRNPDASVVRLAAIKELGVMVALDDFGTGYSSLASLQRLPVDSIKIDQSFISAIAQAPESRALVRTIVQLGRDLGLTTLAEGVETAEQVDLLRGDDVREAQGFLLARPLDAAAIQETILFAHHGPVGHQS